MFILYRIVFHADTKSYPVYGTSGNGTELEQVAHTHRASCPGRGRLPY